MKRLMSGVVVVVFCSCSVAQAGPVLLSSYSTSVFSGVAPISDPRIEFFLQLTPEIPVGAPFGLGEGIVWREGGDGFIDYTSGSDPFFSNFVDLATNGNDDVFTLLGRWEDGSSSALVESSQESLLFSANPDLQGSIIELIRLTVSNISFEPHVPIPDQPDFTGFILEADLTYEFFGTPVPDTPSIFLLAAGMVFLVFGRRVKFYINIIHPN